jgi:hypothetical protein
MTTDTLQDKQIKLRAGLSASRRSYRNITQNAPSGIELTRMQSFVDGGHDIFDILEHHAANTQMKIRTPRRNPVPENIDQSNLFTSLLKRLREQMRDIVN